MLEKTMLKETIIAKDEEIKRATEAFQQAESTRQDLEATLATKTDEMASFQKQLKQIQDKQAVEVQLQTQEQLKLAMVQIQQLRQEIESQKVIAQQMQLEKQESTRQVNETVQLIQTKQ